MGAVIHYSYTELENKIADLKTMKTDWAAYESYTKPAKVGDGSTIRMADQISDAYVELYKAMNTLLDETISFLDNAYTTMTATDQNAGGAMMNGGY